MRDKTSLTADEISPATTAEWRPLAPKFLRVLVLKRAAAFILALCVWAVIATRGDFFVPVWLGVIPLGLGFAAAVIHAAASLARMGYALRQTELLYRQGVWWRELSVVPFNRIQHVETLQGPLERSLGLASLSIYTAGSAGGDVRISGLLQNDAERIRDLLLIKLKSDK